MFPEKGDREKALNSLLGFDCSQPSYNCLALLRPQACGAPSLMARCATPDVGHPLCAGLRENPSSNFLIIQLLQMLSKNSMLLVESLLSQSIRC
jgi:hypothetical protein